MNDSTYTLTFEDRGTYLYVIISGQDSYAASLAYWKKIAEEVQRLGYRKLLVHESLVGGVDEGEVFDIIMTLQRSALMGVHIAFYDDRNEDTPVNALGQLIANNRGGSVRLFRTLDAARNWIEQDD